MVGTFISYKSNTELLLSKRQRGIIDELAVNSQTPADKVTYVPMATFRTVWPYAVS